MHQNCAKMHQTTLFSHKNLEKFLGGAWSRHLRPFSGEKGTPPTPNPQVPQYTNILTMPLTHNFTEIIAIHV